MSNPAVLASRAISTPRTSRMVIEATTSLRASFSLTTLRTISLAFTKFSPWDWLFRIRQLDRQHNIAIALAMDFLREGDRDAAAERILDDEIERLEVAQRVTPDRTLGEVPEGVRDALRCQFALQELPMPGVVADHRNIRGVALVAGARMGEVVDADAHSVPSTIT